jgi:serralysin
MAATSLNKPFAVPVGVTRDEGSGTANYIYGTSAGDNLIGTSATDAIFGGAGNDGLEGGGGNDVLNGGTGFDVLNGGASVDTASYVDAIGAVQVQLGGTSLGSATVTADQGDWLISIENVWGSSYADYLAGDQFSNQLSGMNGNDTIFGFGGADTLAGGAGNDLLDGGAGADRLDGGEGVDTVSYANSASAVYVSLSSNSQVGGDAAGDSFINVENLEGSRFSDTLRGDGNFNTLIGGDGADKLFGEGGADVLIGGRGADVLSGGIGRDTFVISSTDVTTGTDIVTDFERGFDRIDLRSFGLTDRPGADEVGVGPANGQAWLYDSPSRYQLVFDNVDRTLYRVLATRENADGDYYVSEKQALVTLTGVAALTGDDLILS